MESNFLIAAWSPGKAGITPTEERGKEVAFTNITHYYISHMVAVEEDRDGNRFHKCYAKEPLEGIVKIHWQAQSRMPMQPKTTNLDLTRKNSRWVIAPILQRMQRIFGFNGCFGIPSEDAGTAAVAIKRQWSVCTKSTRGSPVVSGNQRIDYSQYEFNVRIERRRMELLYWASVSKGQTTTVLLSSSVSGLGTLRLEQFCQKQRRSIDIRGTPLLVQQCSFYPQPT